MPLGPSRYPSQKPPWPFQLNRDCEQAQGLKGWWPGSPSGGKKLYDHSGAGNHAAISGTIPTATGTWGAGVDAGDAFLLDGSTNYASIPNLAIGAPYTISLWRYLTDFTGGAGFPSWFTGSSILYGSSSSQDFYASGSFFAGHYSVTGQWQLMTYVQATTALSLYVNGIFKETKSNSPSSSTSLVIGYPGGFAMRGRIENACLWNRALSASEVWGLFEPYTRWQLRWRPTNRTVSVGGVAPAGSGWVLGGGVANGGACILGC